MPLDVVEAMERYFSICEEKKFMKDDCNFHELQKKTSQQEDHDITWF